MRSFREQLARTREDAAETLKKNVYQNYKRFVQMSHEIKTLEASVLNLHVLLNELNDLHNSMNILGGVSSSVRDLTSTLALDKSLDESPSTSAGSLAKAYPVSQQQQQSESFRGKLLDAYGKHYANEEDLANARAKQIDDLYESIDGLGVCALLKIINARS